MKWFLKALRQYADFEGRARRREYWMFGGLIPLIGGIWMLALLLFLAYH